MELLKVLINGIDSIENNDCKEEIIKDIKQYAGLYNPSILLDGIPNVDFVEGTLPESGFFEMLDFTGLKNMQSDSGRIISSEVELLKYLFEEEKIKIILGQSISWPDSNQLVGRVTTALSREDLVEYFGAMNKCIRKLKK